ncbi:carotenoid biosynthesis protein [Deinococcus cavernae]|uniref:Carotenoid biosynthesis protein n=1 Tax=Deinococcus cavernae TaxID=2320857 RepID=A0A418V0D8_9DEIO|nr:carotenoid biosynthesis protein [Deinococcus cavernae]RJF69170.1 carotenoid biosynthesis protein [Deinococcus cavernae]
MTYFQYHLIFIVPVLLVLAGLTLRRRGPLAGAFTPRDSWVRAGLWLMPLVAFVYTTPWDNYLVFRQVWTYPPERVLARIGYVPVEEYAFFILQSIIGGLFLFWLLRRSGVTPGVAARPALVRWGGAAFFMGLAFVGALCLRQEGTLYLGLILAWAMPVLAGQWAFGGDLVLGRARLYWAAVLLPTVYLWLTDAFAIHQGIWHISERYTLGLKVGPLPLEEMLFFLVTNLLVVTGLLLFTHPQSLERLGRARPYLNPWLGFAALYLLLKIPVPLWSAGFPLLGTLSTVSLFLAALTFAASRLGWSRAALLAALGVGVGWGVEFLGSQSGWPFGRYSYAGAPAPTLAGVPLLVPLGWFAMTVVTTLLAGGRSWLAGLLLVAWDIGLEPLMTSRGYWTWTDARPLWAGAPIQNFIGWWAVGTLLSETFKRLAPGLLVRQAGLDIRCVYLAEAAFLAGGLLLFGLPGAALLTLLGMCALAGYSWRRP